MTKTSWDPKFYGVFLSLNFILIISFWRISIFYVEMCKSFLSWDIFCLWLRLIYLIASILYFTIVPHLCARLPKCLIRAYFDRRVYSNFWKILKFLLIAVFIWCLICGNLLFWLFEYSFLQSNSFCFNAYSGYIKIFSKQIYDFTFWWLRSFLWLRDNSGFFFNLLDCVLRFIIGALSIFWRRLSILNSRVSTDFFRVFLKLILLRLLREHLFLEFWANLCSS